MAVCPTKSNNLQGSDFFFTAEHVVALSSPTHNTDGTAWASFTPSINSPQGFIFILQPRLRSLL